MDNKEVMNTINKPMSVVRGELINTIVDAVNNSGLPLYFIEPILKDIYIEISEASQRQIAIEKSQYENMIKQQDTPVEVELNTGKNDK